MKIFKIILPIVFIFAVIASIQGQRSSRIKQAKIDTSSLPEPHLLRVGLTPSSVLNEYMGLQFNGAVNLSDKFQFNMELGWIFFSTIGNQSNINGFRIRPAFRFYTKKTSKYQFHHSLGFNYRKTTAQRKEKFSIAGSPSTIRLDFEQDRKLKGLSYMIGIDFFVKENLMIDLGIGIGLGDFTVEDRGIPIDRSRFVFGSPSDKYDRPGKYNPLLFIINFRVQYLIR